MANHFKNLLCSFFVVITINSANAGSDTVNDGLPVKSFHFVWRAESPVDIFNIIKILDSNDFSKLYIGLTKSVCLDYEFWDCEEAIWTAEDLNLIIEHAQSYGFDVALEIKMLNKIKKSFKHLTNLKYNEETLDPELPEFSMLYDATFEYIGNVLGISEILLGYDEIYGFSNEDRFALEQTGQKMLPSNLFIDAVNTASVLGDIHGLSVAIWGDMLIDNVTLPCSGSKHNHGNSLTGYGENLLPYIPKNIKIIAWYYKETQSFCGMEILMQYGFTLAAAVLLPNETREKLLAYSYENKVPETIFTSFRFIRDKRVNSAKDLCNILKLGECSE